MKDKSRNPRLAAVQLLHRVLQKHQLLDEILNAVLKDLSERDRAFARAIASTTLRHLGIIDALIDKMLDRPLGEKAFEIRNIVRIGIAQVLFLKVPPHAAVHDTVELVPANSKYRGLVNALLRRSDRQGSKLLEMLDQPQANTPEWLWDSWVEFYGSETAQKIATAHLQEADLDISVKADALGWAEKLQANILPTGSLRRQTGGNITELPGFDEGAWWVQDASAALPALLFGDVTGKAILDACAAPGGKAAQLAAGGAKVTALDRSKARMKRLIENMDRLQLQVTPCVEDAETYTPETCFDGILLDAPCSSTGTLRRHPDVAYLKSQQDVDKLANLQTRLLKSISKIINIDGTLVYSVCSLQPEEGEKQIEAFLSENSNFERFPVKAEEIGGAAELIDEKGDIRCLPFHLGGLDGFYAARLVKLSGERA
ncbi:MAG: 16S rRNA (cytosine(967)-C(5))-methyltransferase RsmB [Proteobacteria bacterium]|nr:16S rRNA (cytosine(967)-C(5))-methyltransferase RsmB [Pseudomonadota bacterium]